MLDDFVPEMVGTEQCWGSFLRLPDSPAPFFSTGLTSSATAGLKDWLQVYEYVAQKTSLGLCAIKNIRIIVILQWV